MPRPVIDQSHTGPNEHDMLHIKAKCRLGSRELACSYCRTQLSSRSGFVMGAALVLLPFGQGSADVVSYNEPWKTTAAVPILRAATMQCFETLKRVGGRFPECCADVDMAL